VSALKSLGLFIIGRKPTAFDQLLVHSISGFFFVISIATVLGGIALGFSSTLLVLTASKTNGRVIGVHQPKTSAIFESDGTKSTTAELPEPIFLFTNSVGESITVTQRSTSAFHKFPVGSPVKVYYKPSHSNRAEIGDLTLIFFGPLLLVVFGLVGLSFTIFWRYLFLRAIRQGKWKSGSSFS
jgi:hypothetical protein